MLRNLLPPTCSRCDLAICCISTVRLHVCLHAQRVQAVCFDCSVVPGFAPNFTVASWSKEGFDRAFGCWHQVRRRDGVEALDGVDTLAIHLLALLGWTTELDRLAAGSSGASLESVAPLLQQQGQWHSLAMLSVARGRPEDALQIWKVTS